MASTVSLSIKLIRIGAGLLVIALASIGLTLWVTWQLEGGAAAVNEAGRMRMQTWRLNSSVAAQLPASDINALVAQFDQSLGLLRSGDPSRPLFVPWNDEVSRQFVIVEALWQNQRPLWLGEVPPDAARSLQAAGEFVDAIDGFVLVIEKQLSGYTAILNLFQFVMMALAIGSAVIMLYTGYLYVINPLAHLRRVLARVEAVLAVIQTFAPLLGAYAGSERSGRLINLSSMSGRVATPLTGSYAASKHALEAISDVLRVELAIYGIDVVLIEPGPIRTAIWDKAPDYACYQGTDYQAGMAALGTMMAANAERGAAPALVSQAILRAIEAPRPKARYPLHPLWHLARWLPTRLLDRLMAKRVGLAAKPPSA